METGWLDGSKGEGGYKHGNDGIRTVKGNQERADKGCIRLRDYLP